MPKNMGSELSVEQQEDVEERAAILQFDGGLSKIEAERLALEIINRRAEHESVRLGNRGNPGHKNIRSYDLVDKE